MEADSRAVQTNDTIDRNNVMGTMHRSMSALVRDQPPSPAAVETFMSGLLLALGKSMRRLTTSPVGPDART
jgi:hypothetical protein